MEKEEKEEREEEKKDKDVVDEAGADEQELVKKVQEMSVAPVDDGVDFGHDALEATSSAEAEVAPEPLKKPPSSLPSLPPGSAASEVSPIPLRLLCPLLLASPSLLLTPFPMTWLSSFVRGHFYALVRDT